MPAVGRPIWFLTFILAVFSWSNRALALDPSLEMTQYGHATWRNRDGFSNSSIEAIAQTNDGYLWLGTRSGLVRFDGFRGVSWRGPSGQQLPNNEVRVLFAARNGMLWIGTLGGLASWDGSRLVTYPKLAGVWVNAIVEDRQGTIWVATASASSAFICYINRGASSCRRADGSFGGWATLFTEKRDNNLWVGTVKAIRRAEPGPVTYPQAMLCPCAQPITDGQFGPIILRTDGRLAQVTKQGISPLPFHFATENQTHVILADRDGGLWLGGDRGLLHLHNGQVDSFRQSDGLSGDVVTRLFEDREGNIWVVTDGGLDQFHAISATNFSKRQGIFGIPSAVLPDRDGTIWVSSVDLSRRRGGITLAYVPRQRRSRSPTNNSHILGDRKVVIAGLPNVANYSLFRARDGRIWLGGTFGSRLGYLLNRRFVPIERVPSGYTDSIVQDRQGSLWVGQRDVGLLRIAVNGSSTNLVLPEAPGSRLNYRLAYDPANSEIWRGSLFGRIDLIQGGAVRASYHVPTASRGGFLNDLRVGRDGAVWAATDAGLSRIRNGKIATLNSRQGLPCDGVLSSIEDDTNSTWIYTGCGLIRIASADLRAWADAMDLRIRAAPITFDVLAASDGVYSIGATGYSPTPELAKSADGKLWFVALDGVSMVDPRHLAINRVPPPVHIEQLGVDRKIYEASSTVRLPPRAHDIEIDYTALSFVAPERVRFRYKLEGRDRGWQEAGNRREAFYTDLSPGTYRFRVIASNNSGIWNQRGATLAFTVPPAFTQSWPFYILLALAAASLLCAAYSWRLRQVTAHVRSKLEGQLAERERIARELHDTLLQGVQGLILRVQSVANRLPPDRPEKPLLESALDRAEAVLIEGRDRVLDLRPEQKSRDLADHFLGFAEEMGAGAAIKFNLTVEGVSRTLHPLVVDETCRIGMEAIRNAFHHAQAKRIDVAITYTRKEFALIVSDDGVGMEPALDGVEKSGHYGVLGMRERAKNVRGTLEILSRRDAGTQVIFTVPSAAAYASERRLSRRRASSLRRALSNA